MFSVLCFKISLKYIVMNNLPYFLLIVTYLVLFIHNHFNRNNTVVDTFDVKDMNLYLCMY